MQQGKVLMQLVILPESVEAVWDEAMLEELFKNGDIRYILQILADQVTQKAEAWKRSQEGPVN